MGRALMWDVTCVDTLAPCHIRETESRPGAAAEKAETGPYKPEEEQVKEELSQEETTAQVEEELPEEQSGIFPSPSLRKVLPEKIRKYQKQNRIHVLPEEFRTDIDPEMIPKIPTTAQRNYIDILAELTGCVKYRQSLAEYWFLDTLANLLRRAQEDEMCRPSQAVLILWFCEWMKEIEHFDAADRERMLKRFKDNMLSAAKYIAEEQNLPSPQMAGVFYKADDSGERADRNADSKHLVTFEGAAYQCSLRDLTSIIHYIYDLFSTDYQFNLVRAIYTSPPDYKLIDISYQIHTPKRFYAPLKLKPRVEPKEKPGKGKKKEVLTEEYLAFLQLKAKDEKEYNAQEDKEQEAWHRRSHILPLAFATDDQFLDKYWPIPPPEPVSVVPEPKGKGKRKN
ncbi:uncharacterized protein LOC112043978 [Bicyclus anynana]|uniref:Uncharacterized protein LOC112043978 n=1 Tax=Bicyclus anynana TaxID=110368 RepID=A0ABM3M0S3_BICAN|nr:uncharacterized protein LOC112043978 [Bicyclus anynana]